MTTTVINLMGHYRNATRARTAIDGAIDVARLTADHATLRALYAARDLATADVGRALRALSAHYRSLAPVSA